MSPINYNHFSKKAPLFLKVQLTGMSKSPFSWPWQQGSAWIECIKILYYACLMEYKHLLYKYQRYWITIDEVKNQHIKINLFCISSALIWNLGSNKDENSFRGSGVQMKVVMNGKYGKSYLRDSSRPYGNNILSYFFYFGTICVKRNRETDRTFLLYVATCINKPNKHTIAYI